MLRLPTAFALALTGCVASAPAPLTVVIPPPRAGASGGAAVVEGWKEPVGKDALVGTWREDFEGRPGCSDLSRVRLSTSGALELESKDCNGGAPYETDAITYADGELRVRLLERDSGVALDYRFHQRSAWLLSGEVEVSAADDPTSASPPAGRTYKVKWIKVR